MCGIIQLMGFKLSWSIWNNSPLLHKHCSKSSTWSVAIHLIILTFIWQNQYWRGNQTFLQLLETGLTFLGPIVLGIVLQQFCHRLCNLSDVLNKSPVISCESKKTPDLSNRCWCFPVCHGDNFSGVYCYSFSGYNMSEESKFLQPKLTFAELGL